MQRELEAAMAQTSALMAATLADSGTLETLLDLKLRHVRLTLDGLSESQPLSSEVPTWFMHLVWADNVAYPERQFRLADGRWLILSSDPTDEVEEVWDSVLRLIGLFASAAVLSVLAVAWGLLRGNRLLRHLVGTLDRYPATHFSTRLRAYNQPELRKLSRYLSGMASALESERQDNQRLTEELMTLQERERSRLARELHDDLGQYLAGIQASALLVETCSGNEGKVVETARRIQTDCTAMQTGFRRLINSLHPVVLTELGLSDALSDLVQRWRESSAINCHIESFSAIPPLDIDSATHIYRLVQEALTNSARHAGATRVVVRVDGSEKCLRISVQDNGCGLAPGARSGVGLRSMHERARSLGGTLRLESTQGEGLGVLLELPVRSLSGGVYA